MRFPEFTEEWKKCTIKDYGEVITGNTPPTKNIEYYSNGSYLWASPADLGLSKHITSTKTKLSLLGLKKTRTIPQGSILVTCIGSTIGKMGMATETMSTNQQINSVIVNDSTNNDFAYYAILNAFPRYLSEVGVQAVPILSKSNFEKLPNHTTTKEEQRKLGYFLNLLDERIATQNKIIEDLKKLKSAIVDMLLCNQNSEMLKLGDIGYFVRGLTYANEDVTENKAATAVIRANNLNYGNHVDKGEVVYVSRTPATSQILRKGDIVICMANGSSALVGKNSYYPFNDGQSTVGAFCGIYRTSHPLAKWLMQSQRYKRLVYQSLQGGNGAIANLNGDDILNMSFPVMEKEKSKSIIFILEAIEKSLAVNKDLQRSYSTQKSHLLKQMFI